MTTHAHLCDKLHNGTSSSANPRSCDPYRPQLVRSLSSLRGSPFASHVLECRSRVHNWDLSAAGTPAHQQCSLLDRVAPGELAGRSVSALVDPCVENLITDQFVRRRGLTYDRSAPGRVQIADGSFLSTLGTITLNWRFRQEAKGGKVLFHVLRHRDSRYAVTLGGAYLWQSGTLTHHDTRLTLAQRMIHQQGIFFQGHGCLRMSGVCDGRPVAVYPDLASDIPAMSLDFAYKIGCSIDVRPAHRIQLEMPGGRTAVSCGLIENLELGLGDEIYHQHFYVIEGLPGQLLLDAEFLSRTDAFKKHAELVSIAKRVDDSRTGVFLTLVPCSKPENATPTKAQSVSIAQQAHNKHYRQQDKQAELEQSCWDQKLKKGEITEQKHSEEMDRLSRKRERLKEEWRAKCDGIEAVLSPGFSAQNIPPRKKHRLRFWKNVSR